MKFKAPIITLVAGVVVAGVLYTLNVDLSNDAARNAAASQTTTAAAPAASATTQTAEAPPSTPASSAAVVGDGSGNAAKEGTATYAGSVDGAKASLAIVVNNGKALAYVCDGNTVEAWLSGTMANGKIELKGAKGFLTGSYGNGQVKGNVTASNKAWGFTVRTAKPPSGLYRSAASVRDKYDLSWVRLDDGSQQGVDSSNKGAPRPAAPFDVNSKTANIGGTTVPVEAGDPNATSGY